MTSAPLNKQTEMLRLLDEGQVMVHLDPRREGVKAPGYLAEDPVLRLNIAYGFNLPTLEVDDEGVYAVLSCSRSSVKTMISGCESPPTAPVVVWPLSHVTGTASPRAPVREPELLCDDRLHLRGIEGFGVLRRDAEALAI